MVPKQTMDRTLKCTPFVYPGTTQSLEGLATTWEVCPRLSRVDLGSLCQLLWPRCLLPHPPQRPPILDCLFSDSPLPTPPAFPADGSEPASSLWCPPLSLLAF